jgi:hypothetical protein
LADWRRLLHCTARGCGFWVIFGALCLVLAWIWELISPGLFPILLWHDHLVFVLSHFPDLHMLTCSPFMGPSCNSFLVCLCVCVCVCVCVCLCARACLCDSVCGGVWISLAKIACRGLPRDCWVACDCAVVHLAWGKYPQTWGSCQSSARKCREKASNPGTNEGEDKGRRMGAIGQTRDGGGAAQGGSRDCAFSRGGAGPCPATRSAPSPMEPLPD